jgi:hypothetical protein
MRAGARCVSAPAHKVAPVLLSPSMLCHTPGPVAARHLCPGQGPSGTAAARRVQQRLYVYAQPQALSEMAAKPVRFVRDGLVCHHGFFAHEAVHFAVPQEPELRCVRDVMTSGLLFTCHSDDTVDDGADTKLELTLGGSCTCAGIAVCAHYCADYNTRARTESLMLARHQCLHSTSLLCPFWLSSTCST